MLEIGQVVETLVIRLDHDANRIGLSLKRLQPNPWESAAEMITPGDVLPGLVTRQATSGIYISVEAGIEGLIRSALGQHQPSEGTEVQVRVLSFDLKRERMNLELVSEGEPIADIESVIESETPSAGRPLTESVAASAGDTLPEVEAIAEGEAVIHPAPLEL
jgi:ribosomal protein S1